MGLFPRLLLAGVPLHPGQGEACLLQVLPNGYGVALNLPHRSRCRPRCAVRRTPLPSAARVRAFFQREAAVPFFAQHGADPPNLCATLGCGALVDRPLQWYFYHGKHPPFSLVYKKYPQAGNISCFDNNAGNTAQFPPNSWSAPAAAAPRSPYRHLNYAVLPYKMHFKMARRFCHFCAIRQKQPMTSLCHRLMAKERDSNP